jgi:hypothetical protein
MVGDRLHSLIRSASGSRVRSNLICRSSVIEIAESETPLIAEPRRSPQISCVWHFAPLEGVTFYEYLKIRNFPFLMECEHGSYAPSEDEMRSLEHLEQDRGSRRPGSW